MIGGKLQGIGLGTHLIVEILKACHVAFLHFIYHTEQDIRQHLRVIASSVVIKLSQLIVLGEGIQLVILQLGIDEAGKCQCIHVGIGKGQFGKPRKMANKADIKGGIVRYQHIVTRKVKKGAKCLGIKGRVGNHVVGNTRQLDDLLGDGHLGVDKGIKAVNDLARTDLHSTDLGDLTVESGKARRLDIKHHDLIVKARFFTTVDGTGGVVDEIRLKPIDDLDIADFLGGEHRIGKALKIAVVCDGDGGMSPCLGGFDNHVRGDQRVHGGHIGMKMKFHALDGSIVHSLDFGNDGHIRGDEGKILVGSSLSRLMLGVAAKCHRNAVLDMGRKLLGFVELQIIVMYLEGSVAVGNVVNGVHFVTVACGLLGKTKHLTHYHALDGSGDIFEGYGSNIKGSTNAVIGGGNVKFHMPRIVEPLLHLRLKAVGAYRNRARKLRLGGRRGGIVSAHPRTLSVLRGLRAVGVSGACLFDLLVDSLPILFLKLGKIRPLHFIVPLDFDRTVDIEFRKNNALNNLGRIGIVKKADAAVGKRDLDGQLIFKKDMLVTRKKALGDNTRAFGLHKDLGNIISAP